MKTLFFNFNEDSDSMEESKNNDVHEVKSKDKDIRKKIKTSQNKDSNSTTESENKNVHKVKRKNKDIKKKIITSPNKDGDSTKELENENAHKVKRKNKDIEYKIKIITSPNIDSDSTIELENENVHKVKRKNKDIEYKVITSSNKDNDSVKELENENVHKVKRKDKGNKKKIKTSQNKDSDSMKESENEDVRKVKRKAEDIGNEIETLQNKDSNAKKMLKNTHTHEIRSEDEDVDVEEEYCSDATYLARQMALADRLYQSESANLYNLHVQLRHAVPLQHEIETRAGSHMPTRSEIEKIEEIIPIKKGSYSFNEDKIIASNWKAFCKLHNWDVTKTKPFLQFRNGNIYHMRNTIERRKFVQFLADGLPDRTLYSVYHRFKNLYEDNVQRRYKPEEDEMIIDHLERNPSLDENRKYTDLAKALRRTRHSIWRRYRILKKKKDDTLM